MPEFGDDERRSLEYRSLVQQRDEIARTQGPAARGSDRPVRGPQFAKRKSRYDALLWLHTPLSP